MFESHMKPGPSNMFLERRFIKHGLTENNHLKIFKIVSEKRSGKDCYIVILIPYRSSHPEVFCKKGVLGNPTKFIGKHLCQSLFLIKLQASGTFRGTFRGTFWSPSNIYDRAICKIMQHFLVVNFFCKNLHDIWHGPECISKCTYTYTCTKFNKLLRYLDIVTPCLYCVIFVLLWKLLWKVNVTLYFSLLHAFTLALYLCFDRYLSFLDSYH